VRAGEGTDTISGGVPGSLVGELIHAVLTSEVTPADDLPHPAIRPAPAEDPPVHPVVLAAGPTPGRRAAYRDRGGALLLFGAAVALVWANSPWSDSYTRLAHWVPWPGGASWHLDLDVAAWAADGLLAIFFFVVGLELKREFVAGDLRDPRRAALPVVAALGGMLLPALIYVAVVLSAGWRGITRLGRSDRHRHRLRARRTRGGQHTSAPRPTRIPAHPRRGRRSVRDHHHRRLIHRRPTARRAVRRAGVDRDLRDSGAARRWVAVGTHPAGGHRLGADARLGCARHTVAGVLLGFTVPVLAGRQTATGDRSAADAEGGLAARLEHRWRPVSAGFAVPVFALFAAGVTVRGSDLTALLTDPVVISAGLAAAVLVRRNAAYRRVAERERLDADGDGVPDVYQRPTDG
jgi:Na+:H+ antiporter, NhaA family